ncbi:DUF3617 domain-containing protein [Ramlibacter albus]|uniref:DUF3617 domain-containing protein n=1 Tax=Ramlibacter albus TaxID=2079448 RepID=A0A923M810_9BURK|nr:DUF3617 domain-containing protein [Ramlibacter albus]MBC5765085.1 DUF3617 domain-containing protein [Ramlibacter albus]
MRVLVVAAAAALCSSGAAAQQAKPGLWEITTKMGGAAGGQMAAAQAQMAEQMKNMPPDQRKMVEEMMAKQGMRMAPGAGGGTTIQMCITPEMARRDEVPMNKGDCKMTSQQRTGNTLKAAFSCTNPPSTGEALVTFTGTDAYNSKVTVKTVIDGKPETMNIDSSARFLGADCGSVKPPRTN